MSASAAVQNAMNNTMNNMNKMLSKIVIVNFMFGLSVKTIKQKCLSENRFRQAFYPMLTISGINR